MGKERGFTGLFSDIPKLLIPICSPDGQKKPILQWEIENIAAQGFKDIILTVGYMAEKIQDFFGDGSPFGVKIAYYVESTPLGNAGALFKSRNELGNEPFLLLIADALFDVDFNRMVEYHRKKNALVTTPIADGMTMVNMSMYDFMNMGSYEFRMRGYLGDTNIVGSDSETV